MSRNVRFKVSAQELEIIADFCHAVGQPIDTVAKQALFWAINEAHDRAQRAAAGGPGTIKKLHEEARAQSEWTKDGNSTGNTFAKPGRLSGGGAALADSRGVADQASGTEAGAE